MGKLLNQILDNYQLTEEYAKESEKRNETSYQKAVKELAKTDDDVDLLVGIITESEDFGFIQGFKYAMQLMAECNTGIRKIEE